MELLGLFLFGGAIWQLLMVIITMAVIVAQFIIWRNGNRTNRLLTLMAKRLGVPQDEVDAAIDPTPSGHYAGTIAAWKDMPKSRKDS